MLKVKKQPYNSVWISADSQEELGNTFIRFQEHYESPNPNFIGKIFTLGMVRQWYSVKYGADTYHHDWTGFNFPSYTLKPFKNGLFDPLTNQESNLIDLLRYRTDKFYVIGANNDSVIRHELAHALYFNNTEYALTITELFNCHESDISKIVKYILDKGYHEDVIYDELQAYITDNDDEYIMKNTPEKLIQKVNEIYTKYST